jgi:hypothetical protein
VNLKSSSFFLAVILSAATPTFADTIPADLHSGETASRYSRQWIHGNTSAVDFTSGDTKTAEVVVQPESGISASNAQLNLFGLGSNIGYALGRDNDKGWWGHKGNGQVGGRGVASLVAAPEPSSQLLLLIGLAGLGLLFYRRNSVKQAIQP